VEDLMGGAPRDVVWVDLVDGSQPLAPVVRVSSRRSRRWWLTLAGVAVAGVMVASSVMRDDGALRVGERDTMPGAPVEQWVAVVEANPVRLVAANAAVVVVAVGWDPVLVALDSDTGRARWQGEPVSGGVDALYVVDEVVVTDGYRDDGRHTLTGFDLDSGRRRWVRELDAETAVSITPTSVVMERSTRDANAEAVVEVLDARTGRRRASFGGQQVSISGSWIVRRDGELLEVFDRDTLARVRRVDLGGLRLGDDASLVPVEHGVAVATGGRLHLLDGDGRVASRVAVGGDVGTSWVSVSAVDGSADHVLVTGAGGQVVFSTAQGDLRQVWSGSGWMSDAAMTELGVVLVNADERSADGSVSHILDASTGQVISQVAPAPTLGGQSLRLYDDGFVMMTDDAEATSISGVRYDGTMQWHRTIPRFAEVAAVPGGVVTTHVDVSTGDSAITMLADQDRSTTRP
jgi:hypothetical protein